MLATIPASENVDWEFGGEKTWMRTSFYKKRLSMKN